jgi:tRNA (guanine-N7-)-methyltransferase
VKRKLERFRIIEQRENVIEPSKLIFSAIKGHWASNHFRNKNPITLELACGRGEYSVALGRLYPERNFIGVDVKGDRIWKGSTLALESGLRNVAFLRTEISALESFCSPGEVEEIWLVFPDPRPRKRDIKRRLTSPRFLDMYKRLLGTGGRVRLKTDNTGLFNYTLEVLGARSDVGDLHFTADLYASDLRPECYDIRTRYEEEFSSKGESIKYLRFCFVDS